MFRHPASERALSRCYEAQLHTSYQSIDRLLQCHQRRQVLPSGDVGHAEYGVRGASQVQRVHRVRSHAKIVLSWGWNAITACLSRYGWTTEPDSGRWPTASRCRSGRLHHVAHGSGATRASLKDLTKATLMRVCPSCSDLTSWSQPEYLTHRGCRFSPHRVPPVA